MMGIGAACGAEPGSQAPLTALWCRQASPKAMPAEALPRMPGAV